MSGIEATRQASRTLTGELGQVRHEMETRIAMKDEEIESIKKFLTVEIEQLNGQKKSRKASKQLKQKMSQSIGMAPTPESSPEKRRTTEDQDFSK